MKKSLGYFIIILFAGCKPVQQLVTPKIYSSGKYLHIDTLAANLATGLSKNFIKYGFVIRYGFYSSSKVGGLKRTDADPPKTDFSLSDRFNPASVTKVITATGVLQLLDKHKYNIDTSIAAFLPSGWIVHPSIRKISFRQLLAHRGGFNDNMVTDTGYAGLKQYVQTGIDTTKIGQWLYSNSAYDLCRVLIAYLDGYRDTPASDVNAETLSRFVEYMQKNIYTPLGIENVRYSPPLNYQALFYVYPPGSAHGTDFRDHPSKPGAAGVQLSINELSTFLFNLVNTTLLLSQSQKKLMLDEDLGWDNSAIWKTSTPDVIRMHSKGGFLPLNSTQGLQLFMQYYENGLLIMVMYNGQESLGDAINAAYNNSWK